jgi:hypothetical protein
MERGKREDLSIQNAYKTFHIFSEEREKSSKNLKNGTTLKFNVGFKLGTRCGVGGSLSSRTPSNIFALR